MQQSRNETTGDFTLIGTEDEFREMRDLLAGAFGEDDEVVVELSELIDGSSGAQREFVLDRAYVPEVADCMRYEGEPGEVQRVGEEIAEEIERVTADAAAKLEGGEN